MSQNSGPEEDLTLADAEQVGVELQGLDLFKVQVRFSVHIIINQVKAEDDSHGLILSVEEAPFFHRLAFHP